MSDERIDEPGAPEVSDEPDIPDIPDDAEPGKPPSAFREMLAGDIVSVFLDLECFGELHHVGGQMIKCVIDEDVNQAAAGLQELGMNRTGFVMYCRESDLDRQLEGSQLDIDGRLYTVDDWRVDEGMSRVTLRSMSGY